jgi:hypothetical protein
MVARLVLAASWAISNVRYRPDQHQKAPGLGAQEVDFTRLFFLEEEAAMMTIDIKRLSEKDLGQIVAERCLEFGGVRKVRVLPANPQRDYAIAAVDMRTRHEARKVPTSIADWTFASTVVIRILHEGEPLPALRGHLAKNALAGDPPDVCERGSNKRPGILADDLGRQASSKAALNSNASAEK